MKAALITGASGSIGRAIASHLAKENETLYLQYKSNVDEVEKLAKKCENKGSNVKLIRCDLSKDHGPDELLKHVTEPVDQIVHNSGFDLYGLFTDVKNKDIDVMLQLHVKSPMQITRGLLPQMIRNQSGRIVVISSIWGLAGASCEVVYSSCKGAQNSFVKALAKEVAPSGITVNAIAPGAVDTPMLRRFSEEDVQLLKEEIPMDRLAHPKEIADTCQYLLSDRSSYITGQIISVNGGWYC